MQEAKETEQRLLGELAEAQASHENGDVAGSEAGSAAGNAPAHGQYIEDLRREMEMLQEAMQVKLPPSPKPFLPHPKRAASLLLHACRWVVDLGITVGRRGMQIGAFT